MSDTPSLQDALRDQFAAAAMTGLLANYEQCKQSIFERAYNMADAMLRERDRNTPDSQTTPAQGSVRGECTEREPCPYVTGTVTRYCTLTPFTLTDAERESLERASIAYELLPTEGAQQVSATLRGLLERMGVTEPMPKEKRA